MSAGAWITSDEVNAQVEEWIRKRTADILKGECTECPGKAMRGYEICEKCADGLSPDALRMFKLENTK